MRLNHGSQSVEIRTNSSKTDNLLSYLVKTIKTQRLQLHGRHTSLILKVPLNVPPPLL